MSLAIALVGLLLQAQDVQADPAKPFVHSVAGLTCPGSTDSARRVSIRQFDEAALDVGCGYELSVGVTVNVYSYPASESTLEQSYERAKSEISQRSPSFEVLVEDDLSLGSSEKPIRARHGVFRLRFREAAGASTVRSELVLGLVGNRLFKFRASFRAEPTLESTEALAAFYRAFPIPREPSKGE